MDIDLLQKLFGVYRGFQTRIREIDAAIPHTWSVLLPPQSHDLTRGWWGYFKTDTRPLMAMHAGFVFLIDEGGHMHFSHHSATPEHL